MRKINIFTILFLLQSKLLFAAVGCTLNDPDRDIKRIFPESTGYKTEFISIEEKGGKQLAEKIEEKLGSKLEPRYESLDVPYAYYTVLRGKEIIGYVHGVNEKGMYGGMQIILATDLDGKVVDFYYQKISSPVSKLFRAKSFYEQFIGITLTDFDKWNAKIKNVSEENEGDFKATIRGVKKNLILKKELLN